MLITSAFSIILHNYTEKYLGVTLNLRDYHSVMCSMLCSLTQMDFGAPDSDNHKLSTIHTQFSHLVTIAGAHYGIQGTMPFLLYLMWPFV